jgi:hypothetical protein
LVQAEGKFYGGLRNQLLKLIPKARRSRYNFDPVDRFWGMWGIHRDYPMPHE